MHALDVTITNAEFDKLNSIHTTVGGTLSAAIIAGMLVIFIKVYDHYNNKSMRDLKDALDIAKETDRLPDEGKKSIQTLIDIRSIALIEKTKNEKLYMSQTESFRDRYSSTQIRGMIFVYFSSVLLLIGIVLPLAQVIDGNSWGFLLGAIVCFLGVVRCSKKLSNMDEEMTIRAGVLSSKVQNSLAEQTKRQTNCIIRSIKFTKNFPKLIFAKKGK